MISILKIYTSGLSGSRTLTRFFASCLVTVLDILQKHITFFLLLWSEVLF